ncbi:hypothetical protein V5O48_008520 [Marasmius crinis-equi]|uniref:FAD-binding domain-containing protein n=1 Tax=Marasmius crinis-equi TaxID=585013 RepID=A0ABR3FDM6_9AGAR
MSPSDFRVLIVGGSIAGLTLANILERVGIDFLLLESYREWAPDVGASIAMFPYGLRILDQLGCCTPIRDLVEDSFKDPALRNSEGKPLVVLRGASKKLTERLGYGPVFVDRQMVLRILYENIKDKSKCLLNKGVARVEQDEDAGGVRVHIKDGSSYTGTILVGADGVHSTVRREMWRIADTISPGYFPKDRSAVPTEYRCIFGISKPTPGFTPYCADHTMGRLKGNSYLTASGPNDCVYWFLFAKLPKTIYGLYEDLPRFTDDDKEKLAEEHAEDPISETLTFGDLYKNRRIATLTALPEYVMKKWHFGRIVTLGDASHKFNPIDGHGGNSAVESAAVLANELVRLTKSKPAGASFTPSEINTAFTSYQEQRHARAVAMKETSHLHQSLEARDSFQTRLIAKYLFPYVPAESLLASLRAKSLPAARIEALELGPRPHTELWDDELPARPMSLTWGSVSVAVTSGAFLLLATAAKKHMLPAFPDIILPDSSVSLSQTPPTTYTGIDPFDDFLCFIMYIFQFWFGWMDPGHTIQVACLVTLVFPLILIWTVEGHRRGSKGTLISFPGLISMSLHLGGGLSVPIYYLLSVWSIRPSVAGRRVPESVARAVLPASILGYVVPTILMFIPAVQRSPVLPLVTVLYHFGPAIVSMLTTLFVKLREPQKRSCDETVGKNLTSPSTKSASDIDNETACSLSDLPHLRHAYIVTFIFCVSVHFALLFILFVHSSSSPLAPKAISFARLFTFASTHLSANASPETLLAESLFQFAKLDFWYAIVSVLCYSLHSIFAMRRRGLITTKKALQAFMLLVVSQVVVGPSASLAGMWYWGEGVLSLEGVKDAVKHGGEAVTNESNKAGLVDDVSREANAKT